MSGIIPQRSPVNPRSCRDDEATLEWTVHLARRSPRKLVGVTAVAFTVAIAGFCVFDSPLPVLAIVCMLIFSISDFLFPVAYCLTRQGASSMSLVSRTHILWSSVRRVDSGDDGIKLSPFLRPSRLDAFRGVYLRFDGNRSEVIDMIKRMRETSDDEC